MRAFLYAGGPVYPEFITEHPKADDLRIAADSGLRAADALSDRVDILVGDFDSLGEPPARAGMEVVRVPAEKDLTDTQLALEIAVSRGADEIILIAGLSGRLDHTLSTLSVLEDMHARGLHGYITDGQNRVHFLQSSSLLIARSAFRYLSLIAADPVVRGVSVEGCKYPSPTLPSAAPSSSPSPMKSPVTPPSSPAKRQPLRHQNPPTAGEGLQRRYEETKKRRTLGAS
ncbi:MAG: thiamine diphosphokinase [Oscillospiraceae bacterium]|nr:MAG: thiamine diphosphokinase [Oscillospiraceae bacterium]